MRTTATRGQWAPDFLQLAGPEHPESTFECSTTLDGVTGGVCVTRDTLLLSEDDSTVRLHSRDILGWWDTPAGATFSLAVEAEAKHSVVLLAEFHGATVHAMTRAFGPRSPRTRSAA